MQDILEKIFPTIKQKFEYLNLNDFVKNIFKKPCVEMRNPLLKQKLLNSYHIKNNIITWGGWMENRSFMWKGTYMDNGQKYLHLGVDVNVPKGTPVFIPFPGKVIDVYEDQDKDVGWGGRIMIEPIKKGPCLLFGHLDKNLLPKVGQIFKAGEKIGVVGTWPDNGNVFEHVHIQAVEKNALEDINSFKDIDGYGFIKDLETLKVDFPEPLISTRLICK